MEKLDKFYKKINGNDINNNNEGENLLKRMKIISDIYDKYG